MPADKYGMDVWTGRVNNVLDSCSVRAVTALGKRKDLKHADN